MNVVYCVHQLPLFCMPKKNRHFDVVAIGDATLDTFVKIHDASVLCTLDRGGCWMCLNYGEKIPIESLDQTIGGNACNNAVGTARLGLSAALYSILGDDETGARIVKQMKKEGVSCAYIMQQRGTASNYSVVLTFRTDRTILVYHQPRKYRLPQLDTPKWIYLTSLGKEFPVVHASLLKQIKNTSVKLMFNPGTHQLAAGYKALEPIIKASHVLILNKEEAQSLLGNHSSVVNIKELLRGLHHLGPEIAVITDGSNGAYAYDGDDFYRSKPLPAKVLERTGAGDSFSTGFLAALIYKLPVKEALLWGSANASSVVEFIGPQAGLLTKQQLLRRIAKNKKLSTAMK